jgi:hypothetical protein
MRSKEINKRADQSEPGNLEGFPLDNLCVKESTAKRLYSSKAVKAATGIGALAFSAAVFYRVRELLAALLLFSVLFGVVIVAVLVLWFVEEATHEIAVRLETHISHISVLHIVAPARAHANHIHRSPPWN